MFNETNSKHKAIHSYRLTLWDRLHDPLMVYRMTTTPIEEVADQLKEQPRNSDKALDQTPIRNHSVLLSRIDESTLSCYILVGGNPSGFGPELQFRGTLAEIEAQTHLTGVVKMSKSSMLMSLLIPLGMFGIILLEYIFSSGRSFDVVVVLCLFPIILGGMIYLAVRKRYREVRDSFQVMLASILPDGRDAL
jgi:hypothetical protein